MRVMTRRYPLPSHRAAMPPLLLSSFLTALSGAAGAQGIPSPATPIGTEIALQLSDYRYREKTLGVSLHGAQAGVRAAFTHRFGADGFGRIDLRGAGGELQYRGSGVAEDQPNLIVETRYVFGGDIFTGPNSGVAPYLGLGYRYLYSDVRGQTSTGALGYRRYSHYLYMPVGLTGRFIVSDRWIVSPTIEYDHFLRGRQYSQLTDTGIPGLVDAENQQRKGNGYRASLLFSNGAFSFGPWFHVWQIADSDIVPISPTLFGREPKNDTREIGIDLSMRF